MDHPEFLYQEIDEYGIIQSEYLANILKGFVTNGVAFLDAKTVAQPSNIDFVHGRGKSSCFRTSDCSQIGRIIKMREASS